MSARNTILLIEDCLGDIELIREALRRSGRGCDLVVARDGEEASHQLESLRAHPPHFVLLDFNLPCLDGRELLKLIKQDAIWYTVPVIVFSSSSATKDIQDAYELKADCYITKPNELRDYIGTIRSIERFWRTASQRADGGHDCERLRPNPARL